MEKKIDKLFEAALRQQENAKRERIRAERWENLSKTQQIASIVTGIASIASKLAIDLALVPLAMYALYALLYLYGGVSIRPPGSLTAWLLVYWLWRFATFELVLQIRKLK